MKQARVRSLPVLLFGGVLVAYVLSPVHTPFDSRWSIHTAMSILHEGNTDLDEYGEQLRRADDYAIDHVDGHAYSRYPIGASLVALPFVWVADRVGRSVFGFDLDLHLRRRGSGAIECVIASFVVAFTVVIIYAIGALFLDSKRSLALALTFAFCTSAWSTASRALWQHGPSMLATSAALYVILRARDEPRLLPRAALPLAVSYVMRPTNSLSIGVWTAYVALTERRALLRYLAWAAVIALPFLAYNRMVLGALIPEYYRPQWNPGWAEALAANLVSPGRGLLVYSPVVVFSFLGAWWKRRAGRWNAADSAILAIVLLHWLTISLLAPWNWWGGHSFGPRLFSDVLPYLMYFMVFALEALFAPEARSAGALRAAFVLLAGLSFLIHLRGATTWTVHDWNTNPSNIDVEPGRIWDWRDAQFLRGLSGSRG
jgi:hypothetical protein